MLYFSMLMVSSKRHLGWEADCGLMVSFSDHSRIMLLLQLSLHCKYFFEILQCDFSWQAQYLVRLASPFHHLPSPPINKIQVACSQGFAWPPSMAFRPIDASPSSRGAWLGLVGW